MLYFSYRIAAYERESNSSGCKTFGSGNLYTERIALSSLKTLITTEPYRFAPRVQIWSAGSFAYRVSSEQATDLHSRGVVEHGDQDRRCKRIWRVHLRRAAATQAQRTGPATKPLLRHYGTAASVFMEVLGCKDQMRLATYTFHPVYRSDAKRLMAEREFLADSRGNR